MVLRWVGIGGASDTVYPARKRVSSHEPARFDAHGATNGVSMSRGQNGRGRACFQISRQGRGVWGCNRRRAWDCLHGRTAGEVTVRWVRLHMYLPTRNYPPPNNLHVFTHPSTRQFTTHRVCDLAGCRSNALPPRPERAHSQFPTASSPLHKHHHQSFKLKPRYPPRLCDLEAKSCTSLFKSPPQPAAHTTVAYQDPVARSARLLASAIVSSDGQVDTTAHRFTFHTGGIILEAGRCWTWT